MRAVVPHRPIRSPLANTVADPVAGRRPSPVRERDRITSKTAHQPVPEFSNEAVDTVQQTLTRTDREPTDRTGRSSRDPRATASNGSANQPRSRPATTLRPPPPQPRQRPPSLR